MPPTRPLLVVAAAVLALVSSFGAAVPAGAEAPASSTTLVLSTTTSAYGDGSVRATAQVVVAQGAANGKVYFAVDGTSYMTSINSTGSASLTLPRDTPVGVHAVTATFVPRYPDQQSASASSAVGWVVEQVRTRLQLQVTGRRTRVATTVRAQVDGDYGTRPSGRVRVVLHRTGTRGAVRVVVPVGPTGLAVASLGRLPRGAYRAVVTYAGDEQHLRQRRVERFRVGGT